MWSFLVEVNIHRFFLLFVYIYIYIGLYICIATGDPVIKRGEELGSH
jgi:hypothetical protein